MSTKPDLVLDIAGVIATNFSPIYWEDLASKGKVSYEDLVAFRKEVREVLWTGSIQEEEFWTRLIDRFPTIDRRYAVTKLLAEIKPLPALEMIPLWSEFANIHLLSNHRTEWVDHIISPIEYYIKSITISSDVGVSKPQRDIYLKVNAHLSPNENVLFVDDQDKNLIEARNLGWNTLLADTKGEWIKYVSQQLLS
ncbi:HAD family hydrolase [Ferdinandcohnia quinoae]|uniref:HAD-IA family hydrolase n=1 Tax=Fredinandcohnia quinoae TaxID=2918902 RepID=A0AAW5E4R8_9BACI|nr:HAD-IA family hydrolase [Fredinandcohnia sp. SECRCQ15]MCH1627931.1 HAD-IA family hydrolase [Fredinandcohnia sp. SECRCQ15]